ncbi:hypothetical protein EJ06DRAFT_107327 [Trichodelitschia bisporula]|uniref:Uncharacterized protein n=1 Tax=Trichodelitschia bisporula TaxID=703511 RepID=A0A6G1HQW5_9PEZI|nr:hypothetical protein EJ06DRAFT_107327 [Trichodelitschia bisporula]
MCLAELNVSLNSCQHRWYHLLRSCAPNINLHTCPTRLALEGWEIKCGFCPFCAAWPLPDGEFLLFGGLHPPPEAHSRHNSTSTTSTTGPSSPESSSRPSSSETVFSPRLARRTVTAPLESSSGSWTAQLSRANSVATASTPTSPHHHVHLAARMSGSGESGAKNRAMNQRVDAYFAALPLRVREADRRASEGAAGEEVCSTDETEEDRRASIVARGKGGAKKAWGGVKRKSKDWGGLFKKA